jgi:5-methylcytosine-specific restriction endonuclease McrA
VSWHKTIKKGIKVRYHLNGKRKKYNYKKLSISYREYLLTPHWKQLSSEYKAKFPICEVCRHNPSTQVHHKTYKRLFHEQYWDLIAICESCHRKKHDLPPRLAGSQPRALGNGQAIKPDGNVLPTQS